MEFPNELFGEIFNWMNSFEECVIALVSKQWNDAAVGGTYTRGFARSTPRRISPFFNLESSRSPIDDQFIRVILTNKHTHGFVWSMWKGNSALTKFFLTSDPTVDIQTNNNPRITWGIGYNAHKYFTEPMVKAVMTGHSSIVQLFIELNFGAVFLSSPLQYQDFGLNRQMLSDALSQFDIYGLRSCVEWAVHYGDDDIISRALATHALMSDGNFVSVYLFQTIENPKCFAAMVNYASEEDAKYALALANLMGSSDVVELINHRYPGLHPASGKALLGELASWRGQEFLRQTKFVSE